MPERYVQRDQIVGSQGITYRAVDRETSQKVVVKMARPAARSADLEAFRREAAFVSSLRHENIVQVLAVDTTGEKFAPHMVTEMIEGNVLEHHIRARRRLTHEQVAAVGAQLMAGLDAIHTAGIAHRDINPRNALITDAGTLKIIDFGVSAHLGEPVDGRPNGTLGYLAPEVAEALLRRNRGEVRSVPLIAESSPDVFAAGVTMWELARDRYLFDNDEQGLPAQARGRVPPLSVVVPDVPPALGRVVADMTAKNPRDRPTAGEAAEELRAIVSDLSGSERGTVLPVRGLDHDNRHRNPPNATQRADSAPAPPTAARPTAPEPAATRAVRGFGPAKKALPPGPIAVDTTDRTATQATGAENHVRIDEERGR